MSELTGQTIPVVMRISLLNKKDDFEKNSLKKLIAVSR